MKKVIALGVALLPAVTFAQVTGSVSNVNNLIGWLKGAFDTATVLILAAAVVWFLWNTFKFVMSSDDQAKRDESRSGMIYGIIALAVMVSLWGLVNFLTTSAGLDTTGRTAPPLSY